MQHNAVKVLMITESFRIGGKERRLLELLKGFSQVPWITCEVVMFKDLIEYEEVKALPYKIHTIPRAVKKDLSAFFKLNKTINNFKPDIVH
ncbi:MAG: hypothetical protein HC896_05465, partial [Bacteroidales bacterium]|nr:hypothetical protein [Bacteroidales bacterium]